MKRIAQQVDVDGIRKAVEVSAGDSSRISDATIRAIHADAARFAARAGYSRALCVEIANDVTVRDLTIIVGM